jgi:uncharacterized protein YjbI with pentapeptide repeats
LLTLLFLLCLLAITCFFHSEHWNNIKGKINSVVARPWLIVPKYLIRVLIALWQYISSHWLGFAVLAFGILLQWVNRYYPKNDDPVLAKISTQNWIDPSILLIVIQYFRQWGPEFIGIGITVLVVDFWNKRRQEEQLKAQLIREMGGPDNGFARRAVRELRAHKSKLGVSNWLCDGSLKGKNFSSARLEGAHLEEANLREANLEGAHLEGAHLMAANLRGTHLEEAHLERASLGLAHLKKAHLERAHLMAANLWGAHLEEANLWRAHLEEANLMAANLEGAHLEEANLREANLKRARLEGAHLMAADLGWGHLEGANLRDAKYSLSTTWPDRFLFPSLAGAKLVFTWPYLEGLDLAILDRNFQIWPYVE